MMVNLLTEGDVARGRPPELSRPHWRCAIMDPATGAVCTRRPHRDDELHQGYQAVHGAGPSTRLVRWSGGRERAKVTDAHVDEGSRNRRGGTGAD